MTKQDQGPSIFADGAKTPPYLASWHMAFAPRADATGPVVEVWFDRDRQAPRREIVQLPPRGNSRVLAMVALYLAALINNTLCVWGARRVTLRSTDEALARDLHHRVMHLLFYQAEIITDLTPLFIFGLIQKRYGERLATDTDRDQAARLAQWLPEAALPPPLPRPGSHTVVAINIGQHKTSCGLVTLDGIGGQSVSRLHRQPTWPDDLPRCYPSLAPRILRHLADILGPLPPETEAICLSLATPVLDGQPYAVAQIGLTAESSEALADSLGTCLTTAAQAAFPGLPVFCINDAEAQGLFASRFGRKGLCPDAPDCGSNLLSVRLGACPSISYIDATGRNLSRFNEYAWLATRIHGTGHDAPLLATISRAISFHGLSCLAQELGLLEKYRVHPDEAAVVFHQLCLEGNEAESHDALKIYYVLGAHLAMLAHEIHRHTPVRHVQLLGSEANRIDTPVFTAIQNGFTGFIDRHALPFDTVDFTLTEAASAQASLIGAAVGYGDAVAGTA
jgi:hypothetical protein